MVDKVARLHFQPASPAGALRALSGWLIAVTGLALLVAEFVRSVEGFELAVSGAISGGAMAAAATALGAVPLLVVRRIGANVQGMLLGFGAGVMLAASVFSLLLPAFRLFRIARAFRAARGLRLVRILGSINRGMQAVRRTMRRRGFSYVLALSALVLLVGAAGMLTFERDVGGFANYGEALWWTAMLMISLGSDYWPKTAEGRILCFVLSLYGFGLFGYVTATLSSLFIGRDAEHEEGEIASAGAVAALHEEIRALRAELGRLRPGGRD